MRLDDDILDALHNDQDHLKPLLRLHLEDVDRVTANRLAEQLEGYEVFHPKRSGAGPSSRVLLKSIEFQSEESFQSECQRVATLLETRTTNWRISALYDSQTKGYSIELPISQTSLNAETEP